eukprot:scaffold25193_cov41-Cyclotella_meneghiniana.AAC.3
MGTDENEHIRPTWTQKYEMVHAEDGRSENARQSSRNGLSHKPSECSNDPIEAAIYQKVAWNLKAAEYTTARLHTQNTRASANLVMKYRDATKTLRWEGCNRMCRLVRMAIPNEEISK